MTAPAPTWSPPMPQAAGFDHLVVETPGLRTHLAAIGEGEPVVLLHGFPQHWWQWHAIAPVIAAGGYRVYCPDLRGAGWTVADDPHIDRETRLHDLLALFDVLDIERAHLLSHDMGAITAMQLTYDHPERVRAAVELSVPPAFMTFSPAIAPGFRHLPPFIWHRPGASLRGVFSEAYVAQPMSEATVEAHLAPMRRPEIDGAVRPLTRGMILPEAIRLSSGVYRRRRLTVPTLFVFGRRDRPWTEANMGRICRHPERYADRVEFAYVEDAAHFVTDDAPAAVADLTLTSRLTGTWFTCRRAHPRLPGAAGSSPGRDSQPQSAPRHGAVHQRDSDSRSARPTTSSRGTVRSCLPENPPERQPEPQHRCPATSPRCWPRPGDCRTTTRDGHTRSSSTAFER